MNSDISDITDFITTCKVCGRTIATPDGESGYCEEHGGEDTDITPITDETVTGRRRSCEQPSS